MLGAIIGDIIGSRFERKNHLSKKFNLLHIECRMTDDSILTFAVADAYLRKLDYSDTIHSYANCFPNAGFGGRFVEWMQSENPQPYESWGNGSAMRISALPWLINDIKKLLVEVEKSAAVTHNHPEGIKGAQAIALCIFLARTGHNKESIKTYIEKIFSYDLSFSPEYYHGLKFDVSCQGSVPQAIISFLHSTDFVDCLRTAISTGGDSDTVASMAGAIGEAFYGELNIPTWLYNYAMLFIKQQPHMYTIYKKFNQQKIINGN